MGADSGEGGEMDVRELLLDLYGRITEHVQAAVHGLTGAELATPPEPGANPIGWLVWHLTRVQDNHVADVLGADQLWVTGDWPRQFGLEPDPADTGYGHTPAQVQRVRPTSAEPLVGYYLAVARRTEDLLRDLSPGDLDRIVDERWDPPVSLGTRLVSIADDDLQHAGQAAYVRGLLDRSAGP